MAMDWIFDADAHVTEPPDVWSTRVPASKRELAPRVERDDQGVDWWFIGGIKTCRAASNTAAGFNKPLPALPMNFDEAHLAGRDAKARLEWCDKMGVWSQVIYPNLGGFGNQRFFNMDDPELRIECVRAYNDWLIEWCSADARRLIPVMATPFWDIDAAVAEIHRAADLGHKGVLFTGEPQRFGLPVFSDPHWHPFWTAAQERDLPISIHLGSGDMEKTISPERIAANGLSATWTMSSVGLYLENATQVVDLLLSGILPKFPDLQWISVESGIGWVPFVLETVDHFFQKFSTQLDRPEFEMLPSGYFARQMSVCYFYEQFAPQELVEQIGVDNILFETDYPHPACLDEDTREVMEGGLAGQSEEVRHKILWGNSARLYNVAAPPQRQTVGASVS